MQFVQRLRRTLRDESGSALVDAMAGVFILSVAIGAVVFAVSSVSTATGALADRAGQEMVMRSTLSTLSNYPAGVSTTPTTSDVVAASRTVSVTRVRIDLGGGRSLIRAITGKSSADDCSDVNAIDPTPADYDRCLIYEREVTTSASLSFSASVAVAAASWSRPAESTSIFLTALNKPTTQEWASTITPIDVKFTEDAHGADTVTGAYLTEGAQALKKVSFFTAGTPLNFVIRVGASSTSGQLVFIQGLTALAVVDYDQVTNGYYYGSITPTGESKETVEIEHQGAGVKISELIIYGVTQ